jgi:septum formation protein
MLGRLSGRTHRVASGLVFVDPRGRVRCRERVESRVTFRRLGKREIERAVRGREPYDKAGGYGIQGTARGWVVRLEGDYFNVMGLPVARVLRAAFRLGILHRSGGF